MIARYDNDGPGQFLEKCAGGGELAVTRALRQIAGDDDEVRPDLRYVGEQALGRGLVMPPEMQVRDMGDCPHEAAGSGTITRKARGWMQ